MFHPMLVRIIVMKNLQLVEKYLCSGQILSYPFANPGTVAQKYINPRKSIMRNCYAEKLLLIFTECPDFPIQEVRFHFNSGDHIRGRVASIFFNTL